VNADGHRSQAAVAVLVTARAQLQSDPQRSLAEGKASVGGNLTATQSSAELGRLVATARPEA